MDTQEKQAEIALLEGSKALFDESIESLDGVTRAKLRIARERALEELAPRPRYSSPRLWIPVAAAAALVALVTLPIIERSGTGTEAEFETMAAADLEILLGEEELEMLVELEFYEWLDFQDSGETGGESIDGVG